MDLETTAKNIWYTFKHYPNPCGPTLVTAMISWDESLRILKFLRMALPSIYMYHWMDTAIFGDFANTVLEPPPDIVLHAHLHFYINTR
jgi:hypothetical protein